MAPEVKVTREDIRIVDQDLWDAVQVRLKDRGDVPLPQAGRKLYGRAEASRESKHL